MNRYSGKIKSDKDLIDFILNLKDVTIKKKVYEDICGNLNSLKRKSLPQAKDRLKISIIISEFFLKHLEHYQEKLEEYQFNLYKLMLLNSYVR